MSKVIGFVVGAIEVGVGVATGNLALIISGATMLASSTIAALSAGGDKRQAAATTIQIGEVPRQAIFGRAGTAGSLVDGFNHGGKYGTDWEVLVIAIADHLCDALEGFYVNDVYVAYAGDGPVPGYNGQLVVNWYRGTADQSVNGTCVDLGGWSTDDRMAGVAHVVVHYRADAQDAKHPVWSAGRPSFLWVVRGLRCYDPARDDTAGGSGSHRWSDPATREWSENAEICRYNFDRGIYACDRIDQPDQLLIGRGLSAVESPPATSFAAIALCDEDVALAAGGTEKRYRVGGVIAADENFGDVAENFAAAMGGIVVQPEGGIGVEPGHAKAPVAAITDGDLIAGASVSFSDFRSEADEAWCNTVVPQYVEPKQKWTEHGAPIRRHSPDLIEDGGPREAKPSLKLVTSGTQAQRIGEITRRLGRLLRTATITLGPRFSHLEEGDWIVWTSARRTGGEAVSFRIDSFTLDEKWHNTLTLREIAPSVFNWSSADEIADGTTAEAQNPPEFGGAPGAGAWSLHVEAGEIPALSIDGAVESDAVEAIIFEYREVGSADWLMGGTEAPSTTSKVIPAQPNRSYEAAVSYRVRGVVGERLVLKPVTAGGLDAGSAASAGTVADDTHSYSAAQINALERRISKLEADEPPAT